MAIQSNEFTTVSSIGQREDLVNAIYIVAQNEVPFIDSIGSTAVTAKRHDWQTQALATPANNKKIEGDTLSLDAITASVRLSNWTQINFKNFATSISDEIVNKAGRQSDMDYTKAFTKGREIYRDMERTFVGTNLGYTQPNNTTAGQCATVLSWIKTNYDKASDGSNPTGDGTNGRTDGTARTLTESMFSSVMQQCYQSGAQPNLILASPKNINQMQLFNNNSTKVVNINDGNRLGGTFDTIVTPFGTLTMRPDAMMRASGYSDAVSELLILDTNFWKKAFLHDLAVYEFARTADSANPIQLRIEFTLEACNEAASGIVADLVA
jgi:hypothetical protein